ncbi:DUF6454 family protein [Arthrobacter sp. AZCC_0090]|uniref:DUF6454 family protein n=1 Tax=Arthrobacter sp. AZCC_0090 TaxID=2735881 RepID=UPI0016079802|nr:DUF6454 family protein [Arthrobacter sp. AZCC_0090]MBB6404506.1 hypothetical protein [Arthrobacter sp. AZCC_0090]
MRATEKAGPLAGALSTLDRRSRFELIGEIPLDFPTHHPQGMAFAKGLTFLSSVEILEAPYPAADPALRTPGRGSGHVFVLGEGGELIRDIPVGEGAVYHPGGIDFDGEHIWVSVAEYRAASGSIVYTIDPDTFEVRERFRVDDHIGWILRDPGLDLVFGGSWGSRQLFTWDTEGRLVDQWENPGHFVDYQDAQLLGPGLLLCSGISLLPQANGTALELGGLALVEPLRQSIRLDVPISVFSGAGHVITRNPVTITADESGLLLHAAPDDGDDPGGTRILSYRII